MSYTQKVGEALDAFAGTISLDAASMEGPLVRDDAEVFLRITPTNQCAATIEVHTLGAGSVVVVSTGLHSKYELEIGRNIDAELAMLSSLLYAIVTGQFTEELWMDSAGRIVHSKGRFAIDRDCVEVERWTEERGSEVSKRDTNYQSY
jgi:hypothetical protein